MREKAEFLRYMTMTLYLCTTMYINSQQKWCPFTHNIDIFILCLYCINYCKVSIGKWEELYQIYAFPIHNFCLAPVLIPLLIFKIFYFCTYYKNCSCPKFKMQKAQVFIILVVLTLVLGYVTEYFLFLALKEQRLGWIIYLLPIH